MILVNDRQCPGMSGVVRTVAPPVEVVVHNHDRIVVVAQWAPAVVMVSPIPMDPSGPPVGCGDPVPTKVNSPVPSSVVGHTPSPRIIRNPIPSDDRIPDPPAVVVRPPGIMMDSGDPDITIRPFINPVSVISQLCFILIQLRGKISSPDAPVLESIA